MKKLDNFNFAFEAIAQKKFGNSGYGYDERVGLALKTKLYSEDQFMLRIERADTASKALVKKVGSTYYDTKHAIRPDRK